MVIATIYAILCAMNIFITGASSGIGNALAHEYAKRYANTQSTIGLVARRSDHLQQIAIELQNQYHVTCAIYALDVRDSAALDAAAADFITRFGAPNIVIANAGVSRGTLTELKEDIAAFQAIFDINVMGMVHTFAPFIESMKQAAKQSTAENVVAQLIGVASCAGIRGIPGSGAYSASKAAVISYCESLRAEMQHFNIAVSTIAPGYVRTPMTQQNQYKMPFLMDADVFAEKFADAVDAKVRFKIIPWQMDLIAKIMRFIPPCLWDRLMKNTPHKKRLDSDWM